MAPMTEKDRLDGAGLGLLLGVTLILGMNQVAIKVSNGGIQPVFLAGLRSLGGLCCLWLWMRYRRIPLFLPRAAWPAALLLGVFFGLEFIFLFQAIDHTTVTRSSIMLYSMPLWASLAGHFLLPSGRITPVTLLGLCLAFAGVVLALTFRGEGGEGSLLGDALALCAAFCWAGIALVAKGSRISDTRPEVQLFVQMALSIPLLFAAAPIFGPLLRDPSPIHFAGLAFQIVAVVFVAFLAWLWLLQTYPAASVVSFSFLTPIVGVVLGWLLLGEPLGPEILLSLALVALGLVLINRTAKRPA